MYKSIYFVHHMSNGSFTLRKSDQIRVAWILSLNLSGYTVFFDMHEY